MKQPDWATLLTRRHFFGRSASGLGIAALAHLMGKDAAGKGGLPGLPHIAPKGKHVIYLFQSGGPSQLDLFDYKPELEQLHGTELPDSVRRGQRLTGMTASQKTFPLQKTFFEFKRHGESGAWISELLPHTAKVADKLSFIRTMHTEAINHDPAVTFLQTGSQLAGRPSIWRVALLWPRHGERRPAGVHRHDFARQGPRWPSALYAAVGQWLLAEPLSGRQVPFTGRSRPLSVKTRRE